MVSVSPPLRIIEASSPCHMHTYILHASFLTLVVPFPFLLCIEWLMSLNVNCNPQLKESQVGVLAEQWEDWILPRKCSPSKEQ